MIKKFDIRNINSEACLGKSTFFSSPSPYLMHFEPDNNLVYLYSKVIK